MSSHLSSHTFRYFITKQDLHSICKYRHTKQFTANVVTISIYVVSHICLRYKVTVNNWVIGPVELYPIPMELKPTQVGLMLHKNLN